MNWHAYDESKLQNAEFWITPLRFVMVYFLIEI